MWVGRPMRVTLGWARCADNVADILRRGAWYPIVEESADGHVVVEVRQQRVRLSRTDVTIRKEVPDHWSVVVRTGVLRPTMGGRGSDVVTTRSEEHTSELQSQSNLVCRLLLEKKKKPTSSWMCYRLDECISS